VEERRTKVADVIQEGKARLYMQIPSIVSSRMPVFYNPHMVVNRDMSLLVVLASLGEGAIICDPMGASGIRGIRFLLEAGAGKRSSICLLACKGHKVSVEAGDHP